MSTTQVATAPARIPVATSDASEVYNRVFWLAWAANLSLVTANALTFRFAELVSHIGGTEDDAGSIVSVGVIGALCVRMVLGQGIDTYGVRRLWSAASLIFIASSGAFLLCTELNWIIYVARIGFAAGLAGMFTCSIVHIQNRVPAERRTEVIGSLGSSGFVGMILGTQLGDLIFNHSPDGDPRYAALFGGATCLGVVYLVIVFWITRDGKPQPPQRTPPAHRLVFRYWPGSVTLVALTMGVGFTVITVFLTRYSTHLASIGVLDRSGIGTFFAGYATSAFIIRIGTRHWSRTVGRHRMILLGLAGHFVGQCSLPFVQSEWQFLLPAVAMGWGHALLFPAVVSLGAGCYPVRFRGTGTTIVLGFTEVGAMVAGKPLGWIIDHFNNGAGFTQMFFIAAGVSLFTAVVYFFTTARAPDRDHGQDRKSQSVKPSIRPSVPGENESFEDEDDDPILDQNESVVYPFPQVGRNV